MVNFVEVLQRPTVARWVMPWLPWLWLCGLAGVFFYRLGVTGLLDETEPLFAEAARQMMVTGDWITPYFNDVVRFDKPPLIYWWMVLGYKTIGTMALGARLPSAIAATLLVGCCFYMLRQVAQSKLLPYLGSAIVALNLEMLFFGRLGYSDMLLNLFFGGSLLSFFLGYLQEGRRKQRGYFWFFALMGLAVLTKGPVGLVLPGAIAFLFLAIVRKLREEVAQMPIVKGAIAFLLVTVPWYVAVYLANGMAFIQSFFGMHNVERFTSVVNQHAGPWYFHFAIVAVGFLPWSLALPTSMFQVIQDRAWKQGDRVQHLGLFAFIWFAVILIFFSVSATKYITYSLPSIPAAAILVALWWEKQVGLQKRSLGLLLTVLATISFSVVLAICSWHSPHWLTNDPTMPGLGARVAQVGLPLTGAAIWGSAAIAGVYQIVTRRLRWFWGVSLAAIASFIFLFVVPAFEVVDLERQLPLRQLAQTIVQVQQPQEPIVMATTSFEKPSMVFYTQRPIQFLTRSKFIMPYLQELRSKKKASALVLTTANTLKEAEISPKQYQLLHTQGVYRLIRFVL